MSHKHNWVFLLRAVAKLSLNLFGSFHGAKLSLEISLSSYIEEDLLVAFCLLQFELCVCVCAQRKRDTKSLRTSGGGGGGVHEFQVFLSKREISSGCSC